MAGALDSPLIRNAGALWEAAFNSPFLDALAQGTLPAESFARWLSQDYLFARNLVAFQAILLAKARRDCHGPLIAGLVALDNELTWFETHAARLGLNLGVAPRPACRDYADLLMRSAYSLSFPVLLGMLYGVEASYLAAWSALKPEGPYAEFIERWSNPSFAAYVDSLRELCERYPNDAAQAHFNRVLEAERDFWEMSWQG